MTLVLETDTAIGDAQYTTQTGDAASESGKQAWWDWSERTSRGETFSFRLFHSDPSAILSLARLIADCVFSRNEKFKQVTVDDNPAGTTLDQTSDLIGLTNKNKNIEAKTNTT